MHPRVLSVISAFFHNGKTNFKHSLVLFKLTLVHLVSA